jgi:hypothetical protein
MIKIDEPTRMALERIKSIAEIIRNDPKTPWNKDRAMMIQWTADAILKGEDPNFDPAD